MACMKRCEIHYLRRGRDRDTVGDQPEVQVCLRTEVQRGINGISDDDIMRKRGREREDENDEGFSMVQHRRCRRGESYGRKSHRTMYRGLESNIVHEP